MSVAFPPPPIRTPISDKSGSVAAPWLQWFRTLYIRTGGGLSSSNNDLLVSMPEDSGAEELRASVYGMSDAFNQAPAAAQGGIQDDQFLIVPPHIETYQATEIETRLAQAEAALQVLAQQINDIKQGLAS